MVDPETAAAPFRHWRITHEVTYPFTPENQIAIGEYYVHKYLAVRKPWGQDPRYGMPILCLGMAAAGYFIAGPSTVAFSAVLPILVGGVILLVRHPRRVRQRVGEIMQRRTRENGNPCYGRPLTIAIGPDGIVDRNDLALSYCRWPRLVSLEATADYLFLCTSKDSPSVAIPRAAFATQEQFRAFADAAAAYWKQAGPPPPKSMPPPPESTPPAP